MNVFVNIDQLLVSVYYVVLEGVMGVVNYDSGVLVKKQGGCFIFVSNQYFMLLEQVELVLNELWDYCECIGWMVDLEEYCSKFFDYEGLQLLLKVIEDMEL